jgi:hypothetical protein
LRAQELPDEPSNARFRIWLGPTQPNWRFLQKSWSDLNPVRLRDG